LKNLYPVISIAAAIAFLPSLVSLIGKLGLYLEQTKFGQRMRRYDQKTADGKYAEFVHDSSPIVLGLIGLAIFVYGFIHFPKESGIQFCVCGLGFVLMFFASIGSE